MREEMQCGFMFTCSFLFSANLGSVKIGHNSTGMQWTEINPIYTACVCGFRGFNETYNRIK